MNSLHTLVHILKQLSLIHPYSRNKSDQMDKFLTVFLLFLKYNCKGNDSDEMTSCFNTSPSCTLYSSS